jgi:hypothetical protein
MKKSIYILSVLFVLTIIPGILAASTNNDFDIALKSNLSGSYLQLSMWGGNNILVIGWGIPKNIKYTLVYLNDTNTETPTICDRRTPGCQIRPGATQGSTYSSKRYPKAKCMLEGITANKDGGLSKDGVFNYTIIANDNKVQNLWLVKSSDVVCKTGKINRWNPINYFYGETSI